jgi:hypothetical protein
LVVPEGWKTIPARIPYSLKPGAGARWPFLLVFESRRRKGILKARVTCDGQVYQDTIEVGGESRLDWRVNLEGSEAVLSVTNPNDDPVEAEAFMVTPHEGWATCVAPAARPDVAACHLPLVIPPGETVTRAIALPGGRRLGHDYWVVAKLAYNGHVEYRPLGRTSAG